MVECLVAAAMGLHCIGCHAQKLSIESNAVGYMALGTLNAEASAAVARRWTVNAGVKYNPFNFNKSTEGDAMRLRQQSYSIGARFWPWHVYSGWWIAGKAQYQEYSFAGVFSRKSREGDRFGGGLSFGWTYMLAPRFNITFGAGFWAGLDRFRKYGCAVCGTLEDEGEEVFIAPNDLVVSFSYIF